VVSCLVASSMQPQKSGHAGQLIAFVLKGDNKHRCAKQNAAE